MSRLAALSLVLLAGCGADPFAVAPPPAPPPPPPSAEPAEATSAAPTAPPPPAAPSLPWISGRAR
jgi:hypothetical protein